MVAMEMYGCSVWDGSSYGGASDTVISLYSFVAGLGRQPAPQETVLESCVPRTMVQPVALTAREPCPEPEGPSAWRGR